FGKGVNSSIRLTTCRNDDASDAPDMRESREGSTFQLNAPSVIGQTASTPAAILVIGRRI
ncbi:hypothetical protein, partial [Ensifer adhaerens]|uniref:hypothetical protein n=1 Tax=Ensifer adhaerens TaxID=106592 RepID=UPI001AEE3ADC